MGAIIEVQLGKAPEKRRRWPLYATTLRDRHHCPVVVVIVAPDPAVADWARKPIELGPGNVFRVVVLGPTEIPRPTSPTSRTSDCFSEAPASESRTGFGLDRLAESPRT